MPLLGWFDLLDPVNELDGLPTSSTVGPRASCRRVFDPTGAIVERAEEIGSQWRPRPM